MNAAMLRAARYLWSEAVSGFMHRDPYNNVIRTTIDHCAHPMCRDYLHRYLENASGGHIHHDLSHVFDLHRNFNCNRIDAGLMVCPVTIFSNMPKHRGGITMISD